MVASVKDEKTKKQYKYYPIRMNSRPNYFPVIVHIEFLFSPKRMRASDEKWEHLMTEWKRFRSIRMNTWIFIETQSNGKIVFFFGSYHENNRNLWCILSGWSENLACHHLFFTRYSRYLVINLKCRPITNVLYTVLFKLNNEHSHILMRIL